MIQIYETIKEYDGFTLHCKWEITQLGLDFDVDIISWLEFKTVTSLLMNSKAVYCCVNGNTKIRNLSPIEIKRQFGKHIIVNLPSFHYELEEPYEIKCKIYMDKIYWFGYHFPSAEFYIKLKEHPTKSKQKIKHKYNETNCKNCGAPINMYAEKCEYCDTPYLRG